MMKLSNINWKESSADAFFLVDDCFDDWYGAETVELTEGDLIQLLKGRILQIIVEREYSLLIRVKGE